MSHLTKVKTKITDRQAILDTLKELDVIPTESESLITFTSRAYGRTWKMSFAQTPDGFNFKGESDFYLWHFLPAYISQIIKKKMGEIAQFTGKLTETKRFLHLERTTIVYKSEMGQTINFVIDAETNIEVKTEGFTGTNCLSATTGIMAALGSIENQALTTTPDAPDLLNQISY
jgi:Protein of unknown function (DUF2997)